MLLVSLQRLDTVEISFSKKLPCLVICLALFIIINCDAFFTSSCFLQFAVTTHHSASVTEFVSIDDED